MKTFVSHLVWDDQGQDLIEYVLIGSFVSIGALAGATLLGTNLNNWYNAVASWVTSASGSVTAAS
jgi:Flp pilus assembly pilin Flp